MIIEITRGVRRLVTKLLMHIYLLVVVYLLASAEIKQLYLCLSDKQNTVISIGNLFCCTT